MSFSLAARSWRFTPLANMSLPGTLFSNGIEGDLGCPRTRTAHISRRRVLQQILPGAVEALALGYLSCLQEDAPGQFMDLRRVAAMLVNYQQAEIVAGMRQVVAGDLSLQR